MKKVFLGIAVVVALALVSVIWIVKANDAENSDKPVVFGDGNSKNALLVYQNGRSSFSKNVAENIAQGMADDGYKVVANQPGDFLEKDLSKYDVVIFGSPVYAGQTSMQIKKYAESIENYGDAKVICYCVGAAENKDESSEFKSCFGVKDVESFKLLKSEFDTDSNAPIKRIRSILK